MHLDLRVGIKGVGKACLNRQHNIRVATFLFAFASSAVVGSFGFGRDGIRVVSGVEG